MNFYIKTHIVEKGETLELIAKMYHIPEVEMLRNFHNWNVPEIQNSIGHVVLVGQELFIPQKEDIQKIINQRKVKSQEKSDQRWINILNRDFVFPFERGLHSYLITTQEAEKENTHSFLWEAEHVLQDEQQKLFLLKINQGEVKYNNDLPESTVELMASDINKKLFPIDILVDEAGLIQKIDKISALQQQWSSNKNDLYDFYEGKVGKIILDDVKDKISDSTKLANLLNLNIIWGLLLRGLTGKYNHGKCEKNIRILNQYMKCVVKNNILKNENDGDRFYDIFQEIYEEDKSEKIIEAKYTVHINSHIVQEAEIKIQNRYDENLTIKIIQIQMS